MSKDKYVFLRADRIVPYGELMGVMEAAARRRLHPRQAGFPRGCSRSARGGTGRTGQTLTASGDV